MTVQKVNELGEFSHKKQRKLRERIDQETSPSADELLGFDWRLHEQRTSKTISHYFEDDPDASRYPPFVQSALKQIIKRRESEGRTRD